MNWKFWERSKKATPQFFSELQRMEYEEQQVWADIYAEKAAQKKAEWEALPDHRKAARLEYRYLQAMAKPKKAKESSLAALQRAAMSNQAQFPHYSPHNEIGGLIGGYCNCLGNGTCMICQSRQQNLQAQSYVARRLSGG